MAESLYISPGEIESGFHCLLGVSRRPLADIAKAQRSARPARGREDKDENADLQGASASPQNPNPATEQEQGLESGNIRVDDPWQVDRRDSEFTLDTGQSVIHDRVIEHQHQLGRRDDQQRNHSTTWFLLLQAQALLLHSRKNLVQAMAVPQEGDTDG